MPDTQLSWQPGFSLSRKPVKKTIARRPKRGTDKFEQFSFIAEHPARIRGKSHSIPASSINCHIGRADVDITRNKKPVVPDQYAAYTRIEALEVYGLSANTPLPSSNDGLSIEFSELNASEMVDATIELHRCSCNILYQDKSLRPQITADRQLQIYRATDTALNASDQLPRSVATREPDPAMFLDLHNMPRSSFVSLTSGIQYNSLAQRFKPVLDRYDKEFCKIPLTTEISMNPFQCRLDRHTEPLFLVHAVMALGGHHVGSTSTQDHRYAALQLLRKSLEICDSAELAHSMLDTIVMLFALDETQSAFGNWRTHLMGAYALLEACGGANMWATSTRVEVQVGLLIWWDAITSLVSREDCVFPDDYFQGILSTYNGQQWDYYGLCGCPLSLVKLVMQVMHLAVEKRKALLLPHVRFENTIISGIEHSLESWHHVSPETALRDEESMQEDRDSMHCSEAWRNGLLLYIYRVFQWNPGNSVPMSVVQRARVVVDHVFACRDDSMVPKQALLPLIFAGCELKDASTRKAILRFCATWDDRIKYHMFSDAIPLLEGVWAQQEMHGFENVWWGEVVDKRHTSQPPSSLPLRLCFG